MAHVIKDDTVMVIAGRDRGKTGKVLHVYPDVSRALVQGINYVKKHARKTQQDQQGGIQLREAPIHISNLMVYCTKCNKKTRLASITSTDGVRSRACKNCGEML